MSGHLKLVSFTAENLDIGSVLTYENAVLVESEEKVNAALSLYFQWTERALALARVNEGKFADIKIEYDLMDLQPEYFWAEILLDQSLDTTSRIEICFELFNISYAFRASIDEAIAKENGKHILYFRRPTCLKVFNIRQTPRRLLAKNSRQIAEVSTKCGSLKTFEIREIGPNSIVLMGEPAQFNHSDVKVKLNAKEYSFKFIRSKNDEHIFSLNKCPSDKYTDYFKAYARFAFPQLRDKTDIDHAEVIQMYQASGFYGKGNSKVSESEEKLKSETLIAWNEMKDEKKSIIEMVALDANDKVVGSSCLAEAFKHDGQSFWVIHHLAAITDPNSIRRTTDLYLWRIEYLLGLNANFSVCCWYDSKSKWIDRIWTKFHRTCLSKGATVSETETYAFKINEVLPNNEATSEPFECEEKSIGNFTRYLIKGSRFFGGIGPQYLNASGFLNHVCFYEKPPLQSSIEAIHKYIGQNAGLTNTTYRVTVPKGTTLPILENRSKSNADRFCIFPNDSLNGLLSSLMHSLAVMERKHEIQSNKTA